MNQPPPPSPPAQPTHKVLYRTNITDSKISGVAGGMARYLGLDPTLTRVLWAVGAIFLAGSLAILYLVLWAVLPTEEQVTGARPPPPAAPGSVYR